jgi:hypothetical protein
MKAARLHYTNCIREQNHLAQVNNFLATALMSEYRSRQSQVGRENWVINQCNRIAAKVLCSHHSLTDLNRSNVPDRRDSEAQNRV